MGGASLLLAFLGRVKYRNTSPITRGTAATGEKSMSVSIVDFISMLLQGLELVVGWLYGSMDRIHNVHIKRPMSAHDVVKYAFYCMNNCLHHESQIVTKLHCWKENIDYFFYYSTIAELKYKRSPFSFTRIFISY